MAQPRSAKILISVDGRPFDFMWATVMPDASVIMGFRFEGSQQIELVAERDRQLRPPLLQAPRIVCYPKISFHPSGQYKLDATMGLTEESMDWSTVVGPRLQDIQQPRRMLEVLLPDALPNSRKKESDVAITLDASNAPRQPLICTISCMAKSEFHRIMDSDAKFVSTSTWEFVNALESESHVWVWTLRASSEHLVDPKRFILHLPGEVKWGAEIGKIA
jgi:hypothetical protein